MSLNRERNDEKETEFVNRELFAANRHSLLQEEVFMERESGFYYLPVELVIHIWKFLDAHIIDTILTRTCRLWNQIVAKNGSRLPAHQLEDVKIENRPGTGETIKLLSRKTRWDACTISSFCTVSYGIYIDFLSLHQRLNRISPVDDLELQFHGQNARDVLRAVSKVARNHWKPRRLFVYGRLHTGDGGILKAAMSNLNAIENLKWLVMRVRMDFGGFDVTPFLTKQLEHIDIGGGFPYSASNLITNDVFVSMLHEKTREIRINGASITVAGVKRFIEIYAKVLLLYNNAQ